MRLLVLGILMFIFNLTMVGQSEDDMLAFYADVMVNADEGKHRNLAHESFLPLLRSYLEKDSSFNRSFEDVKWVSVQYPEDRSFRIISWQLMLDEDNFKYFGFVQKSDGKLFELKPGENALSNLPYLTLDQNSWAFGLNYRIYQYETEDRGTEYLCFNYRQLNKFEKIKLAESISFDGDNIKFGNPIFIKEPESERPDIMNRIVLQYSADSRVNLNYNENFEAIVFDNLIPVAGRMKGQGPTSVSDGSYKAYALVDGKWNYIDKLFDHVFEEAPRPKPVFEDSEHSAKDVTNTKKSKGKGNK